MKQRERIIYAMIKNRGKKYWYAKDYQIGEDFVGYEASARMSEVANIYEDIIDVGKDGRYRVLSLKEGKEKEIQELKEILESKMED